MKRWLLCLFTYNRFHLLANAVRSIEVFFPWGDRLIVDDSSSDPRVVDYLAEIARRPNWCSSIIGRRSARNYGGYYNNMRYALEYALERGYDYCFFFEDDEQMVWKKDDYPDYVENVFETCPDAIQMQPLFFRRISSYSKSAEYIQPARVYRTERGFSTTAIWNLRTVRKHPDYRFMCTHGDDLPANSAYWMRLGYRLYLQFDPTVAIIPWVKSHSFGTGRISRVRKTLVDNCGDFLLKPLTSAEIEFLQRRPPSVPAYQEYFDLSPENTARLIWHQRGQNLNRFYQLCRDIVEEEDIQGKSPVPVPILDRWSPTRIPPLQSHLDWNPTTKPVAPRPTWRAPLASALSNLLTWLIELTKFNIRDYLGYLELTRRMKAERRRLPFDQEMRSSTVDPDMHEDIAC